MEQENFFIFFYRIEPLIMIRSICNNNNVVVYAISVHLQCLREKSKLLRKRE